MTGPLSLALTAWGTVRVEAESTDGDDLRAVQLAFAGAIPMGVSSFEVDLAEFLASLRALARWPGGQIDWSPELQPLANRALADSAFLDDFRGDPSSPVSLEDLQNETVGNWIGELREFQLRDLSGLLAMRHGANYSVPGAGKTRVALALFAILRARGVIERAIVVAPKSAHESWTNEAIEVFAEPPVITIYSGGAVPQPDILLINYERLPGSERQLLGAVGRGANLLVLDEAHRMKRGAAGAYGSVCLNLGPLAVRRLTLSGTPAPNGPSDLRSLMEFNWPGRGGELVSTANRANSKFKSLFTRTTKPELGIPELTPHIKPLQLPPLHREIYDALTGQLSRSISGPERIDDLGRATMYLLMAATSPALLALGSTRYEALQFRVPPYEPDLDGRLRSLLSELPQLEMSPKLLEATRLANENADQSKRTLIWSTFVRNLTSLKAMLADLNPQLITGSTSDEDRARALATFRSGDSMVLLSNPATLGEGVSLHRECHDAIYVDRDFAAGRYLQSVDRIHRLGLLPGTETNVTVLVSDDTIDNLVEARLTAKLRWMSDALDDRAILELGDLEQEREDAAVIDASDAQAVWDYLHGRAQHV